MDKHALFTTLRNGIHDDSATQTWATAEYGRNHSVYTLDDRESPVSGATAYPTVGIAVTGGAWGHDEEDETCDFEIVTIISEDDSVTTGKAKAVEAEGHENILDFSRLVNQAFVAALPAGYFAQSGDDSVSENNTFPIFRHITTITVVYHKSKGDSIV